MFDLETDGLLSTPWESRKDPVSLIHCAVVADLDSDEVYRFRPGESEGLLDLLRGATLLSGHNIVDYDLPVLEMLCGWVPRAGVQLLDTRVAAEMAYPRDRLFGLNEKSKKVRGPAPTGFLGGHSLKLWAWRAGSHKDSFGESTDWKMFSEEMLKYCEQDVLANVEVFRWLVKNSGFSAESMILDSACAAVLRRQRMNGVKLDIPTAVALGNELAGIRDELARDLREVWPPWYESAGKLIPKRSMRKQNKISGVIASVAKGCEYERIKLIELNPSSRHHVSRCLQTKYGWEPTAWNKDGSAKIDRAILRALPYPEAQKFAEYEELQKKLTMVTEGPGAWLQLQKNGVIHGRVNVSGAKTGRMTHTKPNCAQVPAVGARYGAECRSCFGPTREDWVMVGCDASGLELRMLAHYMARWDDGAFAKVVVDGDIHEHFRKATGLYSRSHQKTFNYAFLYGAADPKLGETVHKDWADAFEAGIADREPPPRTAKSCKALGKTARGRLMDKVPALDKLSEAIKKKKDSPGFALLPDGRQVYIDSKHAALNMLLQGAGAIVMKKALIILDEGLRMEGLKAGDHYEFILNVHDEWQIQTHHHDAKFVGRMAQSSITLAGEAYQMRCPLDGEFKIGRNWAQTH
jgi:hypothetical protein